MNDKAEKLQQAIDDRLDEIQPQRDLWPGIEHAINKPAYVFSTPAWAAVAAVMLICLLSALILYRPGAVSDNGNILQVLATMQEQHDRTKQALMVRFESSTPSYPQWKTEMKQLEEAETVLFDALQNDPNNLTLLNMLRQIQDKQIELLNIVYTPRLTAI